MKRYKQINNLVIYNLPEGGWIVKNPYGRFLETFAQRHSAENFCEQTFDFIKNKNLKMFKKIIHNKKQGIDCTEQESAEIKGYLRETEGQTKLARELIKYFIQEYTEVF